MRSWCCSLDAGTSLRIAVENGDADRVRRLLRAEDATPNAVDDAGTPLLTLATVLGHADVVDAFLAQSPYSLNVDTLDSQKKTALMRALEESQVEIATKLLNYAFEHELDVNVRSPNKETAFHIACKHQSLKAVQQFLTQCTGNRRNTMTYASTSLSLVDVMLAKTHDDIRARPGMLTTYPNGDTIAHKLVKAKNPDRLKLLLESVPQTDASGLKAMRDILNTLNGDKLTPLHIAVIQDSEKVIQVLMTKSEYIDFSIPTGYSESYLHLAAEAGKATILRMLLDNGARKHLDMVDKYGESAYMIASNDEVRDLLRPDVSLLSKVKSTDVVDMKQMRDILYDKNETAATLEKRNTELWKSQLKPMLQQCGTMNLPDDGIEKLEMLLMASRQPGKFEPRKSYADEFNAVVANGMDNLQAKVLKFQAQLSKDAQGKDLLDKVPKLQFYWGAEEETISQFQDDCLGSELMDEITAAIKDDLVMIRVLRNVGCVPDAAAWLKLLAFGVHQKVEISGDYFERADFRKHLPPLVLTSYSNRLSDPFHAAVKKVMEPCNVTVECVAPKTFARVVEKSERYQDMERRVMDGGDFASHRVFDFFRCSVIVKDGQQMMKVINTLRNLQLSKHHMELCRLKNHHHFLADAVDNIRFVQANVRFSHENVTMIGEIRIIFEKMLKVERMTGMLELYESKRMKQL
eukprot:GEMP01011834.1.p1 GENE.GEMP01011834.1~~GEMP01011834.1.p1  ORF type:complete len:690 (+),score=187.80 GEMP01011834.1:277-2346(+)